MTTTTTALLAKDGTGFPIQAMYLGPTQHVAIGAASAAITNPVATSACILHSDCACYVLPSEVATPTVVDANNGFPLDAGAYVFARCVPGQTKFTVIQRGAVTGTLWVTEGN